MLTKNAIKQEIKSLSQKTKIGNKKSEYNKYKFPGTNSTICASCDTQLS